MRLILFLSFITLNVFGQNADTEKLIMVSSSQVAKSKAVRIGSADFDLVLKNDDTLYLATVESTFATKEGISVGRKFSELPDEIRQALTKENGWGYYSKLPSGWSIGFCEGSSCTESYPKADSKVKWIFKRK